MVWTLCHLLLVKFALTCTPLSRPVMHVMGNCVLLNTATDYQRKFKKASAIDTDFKSTTRRRSTLRRHERWFSWRVSICEAGQQGPPPIPTAFRCHESWHQKIRRGGHASTAASWDHYCLSQHTRRRCPNHPMHLACVCAERLPWVCHSV